MKKVIRITEYIAIVLCMFLLTSFIVKAEEGNEIILPNLHPVKQKIPFLPEWDFSYDPQK